jgi:hypothetical protein
MGETKGEPIEKNYDARKIHKITKLSWQTRHYMKKSMEASKYLRQKKK